MNFPMLYQARSEIKNLTDDSDDLVRMAQNGDDEAFGLIFRQHSRFVYKFIYAMRGEPSRAEELTQETFLAAYQSLPNLRGAAHLRTWLCGIAKNIVYKSFRDNRQEAGKCDENFETFDGADEKTLPPDRELLSKELNLLIRAALAELDTDKRAIFILKELQNLSYKEISEITGCTIPKLKTDLHRAKIQMRRALHPYLEVKQ